MPFDGNGNYTLPTPSYPAIGGATISSTYRNTIDADLQTALSNCVTRDGQSPVTANLPMAGFKFTGLGAGSANGNSLRYEQLDTYNRPNLMTSSALGGVGAGDFITYANGGGSMGADMTAATGRFTAPAAGTYLLFAEVQLNSLGGVAACAVEFRKNGGVTPYAQLTLATSNEVYDAGTMVFPFTLAAGDYITVYHNAFTGSGDTFVKAFTAIRVGGAP